LLSLSLSTHLSHTSTISLSLKCHQHISPSSLQSLSPAALLSLQKEDMQQQIIRESFQLLAKRPDTVCNFLEGGRYQLSAASLSRASPSRTCVRV
jgi:hypothetical protein